MATSTTTDTSDNKGLETFRERLMKLTTQKESESTDSLRQYRVVLDYTVSDSPEININLIISCRTRIGAIVTYAESLKQRNLETESTHGDCYIYSYRYFWNGFSGMIGSRYTDGEIEKYMMSMIEESFDIAPCDDVEIHFYELGEPQVYHASQLDVKGSSKKD